MNDYDDRREYFPTPIRVARSTPSTFLGKSIEKEFKNSFYSWIM